MDLIKHLKALEARIYAADTHEANKYAAQLQDALYEAWPKLQVVLDKTQAALDSWDDRQSHEVVGDILIAFYELEGDTDEVD